MDDNKLEGIRVHFELQLAGDLFLGKMYQEAKRYRDTHEAYVYELPYLKDLREKKGELLIDLFIRTAQSFCEKVEIAKAELEQARKAYEAKTETKK